MADTPSPHTPDEATSAAAATPTRRGFLQQGVAALAGATAVAAAISPLRNLDPSDIPSVEEFLQKHYKEMTPEDKTQVFARIEAAVQRRFGVELELCDPPPLEGVEFVYGLNLSRCIGCRKCVHACVQENNLSRDPEIQYIRVLEMEKGSIDVETAEHYYAPEAVPNPDKYYMPVQCHQCAKPPCVKVCPVEATWQEPDGITVIDYDWCIGCRYCEAACPYWARRFNFTAPRVPAAVLNPDMSYLSNRPRSKGVMEKCTFCLHRTRAGACRPAWRSARPVRGSSATCSIRTARSPTSYGTSGSTC